MRETKAGHSLDMLFIPKSFKDLMKTARKKGRLTQAQLAEKISVSRARISRLETDRGKPTDEEIRKLASTLQISTTRLRNAAAELEVAPGCALKKKFQPTPEVFLAHQDRPSYVRLSAARLRAPEQLAGLEAAVASRSDLKQINVFLRDAAFDSDLEMIAVLQLLSAGAVPIWAAPQHWGFYECPVTDGRGVRMVGHLRTPSLLMEEAEAIIFPQCTLLCGNRPRRPDILIGQRCMNEILWFCVEIDGEGHCEIPYRPEVNLPTWRLTPTDVLSGSLVERLLGGRQELRAA